MAREREIVITGLGVVSPIGIGLAAYRESLHAGRSGVRPITQFDCPTLLQPFAGEVSDFDGKQFIRPRKTMKVMSRPLQLGFAAAELAMQDAGLAAGQLDPDRFGVLLGSEFIYGELEELHDAAQKCQEEGGLALDRWYRHVEKNVNPLWMLKYLPNMAACHIGIAHDARGPNNSITSGEAASILAMMEAARNIERGHAEAMLSGGVGCVLNPMHVLCLNTGELSLRKDDPAAASRPFDADRDGRVNGEGAAIFVLEAREHAERRGAKIYARLLGFGSAFEPAKSDGSRTGRGIEQSIARALADAGLAAGDIGHVNAHGLSTRADDQIEAAAIRATLGEAPVTALKSYFGSLSSGTGAVELVASLIAFDERAIPPTLNYERPDPACPVNVVHGGPLASERRVAICLNQSGTGQAAAMVVAAE